MNNQIHLIGNAHLDPTWLWRWQEGCGEVLQTFRSAVDRLKEYDDFIFTCSSACYYQWVEEIDPQLFEEIREMVKAGRWVPVNGWFVQPDCNMPSAESFARQSLYSQLYYQEKFGKICETGYNVDSFGHNAMLPQLLVKGKMRNYVMMRPGDHENSEMPKGLFWWDSADGSRVLTYRIPTGYGECGKDALDKNIDVLGKTAEEKGHGMMLFYGVGNHGGGPTKGDIEYLKSLMNDGCKELKYSSPDEYFKTVCADELDIPSWSDELQHHASGCYSATSVIKQLNRQTENALVNSEKWNVVASKAYDLPEQRERFKAAWLNVCYNQFHDIMCGCSIMESYEDAKVQLGFSRDIADKEENKSTLKIAQNINTWLDGVSDTQYHNERHHCRNLKFPRPIVVFNPLAHEVTDVVKTYHPSRKAIDSKGNDVVFQNIRSSRSNDSHKDTAFKVTVPALGYATYWLWHDDSEFVDRTEIDGGIKADDNTIENKYLKVVFDKKTGGIASLVTKNDGVEHICEGSFIPTVIDNSKPDTWAHNIFKFHDVLGTMELSEIKLVEQGPARALMRVKHKYNGSYLSQDFILNSDAKHIDVSVKALWQEELTMLKMPVTIPGNNPISTYEIPGGYIKRPCNGEEEPALTWGDVTADNQGVALISNAKYSYDCPDNTLRLTMLRNSIFADHYSDRPYADFNYCDEGMNRFDYAIYPHSGAAEKSEVIAIAQMVNNRLNAIPTGYHKGSEPQVKSFITIDKDNVALTGLKYCEDGSGDVIMRLNELAGKNCRVMIMCDMLDCGFYADFAGQEIKTFRIDKEGYAKETDFLEGII